MRIGARGSELAQWQARWVAERLNNAGIETTIHAISTHGDRNRTQPLHEMGVTGVFTKELEEALLADEIDLAVHSLKDTALRQPDGLAMVAVTEREDPSELLIIRKEVLDNDAEIFPLAKGAVVGSGAVRRTSQAKALRPDFEMKNLRGNVPTRLGKLRDGDYDAIFLAAAGVGRLEIDLSEFNVMKLLPTRFVPSPAQGALGIEMRANHPDAETVRRTLEHAPTALAVTVERSFLRELGGGCSLPLGAHAFQENDIWQAHVFWGGNPDNPIWMRGADENPEALADRLQKKLHVAMEVEL
jgi:hydroxymethylbilane synthase